MITERVCDPMHDSFECTLMAFCTVKTSADYQLKHSKRTKTQTAYAVIVDVLKEGSAGKPPVFLVKSLSKLDDDEAAKAPEHMRRRIQFAAQATAVQGKNKKRDWTQEINPAMANKCRKLGKAPTDRPLPEYKFSKRADTIEVGSTVVASLLLQKMTSVLSMIKGKTRTRLFHPRKPRSCAAHSAEMCQSHML